MKKGKDIRLIVILIIVVFVVGLIIGNLFPGLFLIGGGVLSQANVGEFATLTFIINGSNDYECGNGMCDTSVGENSDNCPQDCLCGDDICDLTENEYNCIVDCLFTINPDVIHDANSLVTACAVVSAIINREMDVGQEVQDEFDNSEDAGDLRDAEGEERNFGVCSAVCTHYNPIRCLAADCGCCVGDPPPNGGCPLNMRCLTFPLPQGELCDICVPA